MNTLPFSQRPTETPRASHKDEAAGFHADYDPGPPRRPQRSWGWVGPVAAIMAVMATAGVWTFKWPTAGAGKTGSLRIESDPVGAAVDIDGAPRGLTPITLDLAPGKHNITVSHGDDSQQIATLISAGSSNTQHFRWAAKAPAKAAYGRLDVTSEPAGGAVTVDGSPRGTAPLSLDDLEPGDHQVSVQVLGRTQKRSVTIEAGNTASLVFTNASSSTESGWLAPRASTQLQIFEGTRLIGNTDSERIMLPVGKHDLEFVADALGFRARRSMNIVAGETTNATVSLPQAAVNLNAVPWADVQVDGKDIGQTPIANLMLPIGSHQVTFRHPELGDKTTHVTVSLKEAARVAVDMRAR